MPAASSDDARGASSAASVLAPSEGETEDPRISAYVAHLAHVGDEMAAGLGALFADAFPEVPTLADIHEGFTFSMVSAGKTHIDRVGGIPRGAWVDA